MRMGILSQMKKIMAFMVNKLVLLVSKVNMAHTLNKLLDSISEAFATPFHAIVSKTFSKQFKMIESNLLWYPWRIVQLEVSTKPMTYSMSTTSEFTEKLH